MSDNGQCTAVHSGFQYQLIGCVGELWAPQKVDIGREDFIAMKLFAHGPQDIVDAELALAAAGSDLDLPLLERLASGFGTDTAAALKKALARP